MTRVLIALCLGLGVAVAGFGAGWKWRGAEVAELQRQHAQEIAYARGKALAEVSRITHRIQEAQDAEHFKRKDAEAAARRSAAAAVSLRDELAATRQHVAGLDWEITSSRETARATVSVLTQLLGQCSERRRELARFADEAASAGRLCERAADALILEPK